MDQFEFYRVSCAKNTFLVCSLLNNAPMLSQELRVSLAKKYCKDFKGLKTDGFIFLEEAEGYDFKWDFYNADGSGAEMCGNAARGVALLFNKLKQKKSALFKTRSGPIFTEILSPDQVRVKMPNIVEEKNLALDGNNYFFVNTGVPHLVVEQKPDFQLGKKLRSHPQLGPGGANVTFVQTGNPLQAVTFERGVEDFTQACGTGAVAAARWIYSQSHKKTPQNAAVQVQMPGGILSVEFFGPEQNQVYLQGQAIIEFSQTIPVNDLGV